MRFKNIIIDLDIVYLVSSVLHDKKYQTYAFHSGLWFPLFKPRSCPSRPRESNRGCSVDTGLSLYKQEGLIVDHILGVVIGEC